MSEKIARFLHKLGNILLVVWGVFFLIMGATDIGQDRFGVILGFGVGIPLLAVYILRKRKELRARARRQSREEPPAPLPPVTCTQCGATGRGLTCEYCGSPLPRPGGSVGKRGGRHG